MEYGKWLYFAGIVLIIGGAVLSHYPGVVSWFGKLPGDVRIQSERVSIFIPITSLAIVSVVVTVCALLIEAYLHSKS